MVAEPHFAGTRSSIGSAPEPIKLGSSERGGHSGRSFLLHAEHEIGLVDPTDPAEHTFMNDPR